MPKICRDDSKHQACKPSRCCTYPNLSDVLPAAYQNPKALSGIIPTTCMPGPMTKPSPEGASTSIAAGMSPPASRPGVSSQMPIPRVWLRCRPTSTGKRAAAAQG